MKKIFLACWVMLTATLLLPSCLGSDDDATYYDDVAITSFSLGTLNRYLTTTSSAGDDSIYKVSYAGSTYKVAIDQLGGRIFNCDSLPIKTDLKHVVCTLATRNSALVTLKSMISDSLFTFSSTDSLDFSEPRTFRVFSTDGEHHRDYVVSLSVRQYEAGTLLWTAMEDGQMPEIDMGNFDYGSDYSYSSLYNDVKYPTPTYSSSSGGGSSSGGSSSGGGSSGGSTESSGLLAPLFYYLL